MSGFLITDIETLGTDADSVILSLAICYIDISSVATMTPLELVEYVREKSLFVKLDAKEQLAGGRKYSKSTLDWWASQPKATQEKSLIPSQNDASQMDAYEKIKKYIADCNGKKMHMFARGSMDEKILESFCNGLNVEPVTHWGNWRDVRTAIDVLYGSSFGYCDVDGLTKDKDINKHNPVDDIAFDVAMMLFGKVTK